MSASNGFETGLLTLLFLNTVFAAVAGASTGGDLPPTTTLGNFTIALHVGTPGEAGTQLTNEAAYTSYARVTVARGAAQWTEATGTVDNDNSIDFPAATGGSSTVDFFSVGSGVSDVMHLFGAVSPSLAVTNGITPSFAAGALDVTLD
jgi:hypothetical protein